jgi:hypothetical protein
MSQDWQRTGNVLAWPRDWQQPARTEEWFYQACLDMPVNRYVEMVCFPWATLIDLLRKGKTGPAQSMSASLRWLEPRTTLMRATACQHIYAKDMWPVFKRLKITDLFWAHARKSELEYDGIRIHPLPLYPVCWHERDRSLADKPLAKRKYLYSFVGAHQAGLYESEVREWIFGLAQRPDAWVERRAQWHFERVVYGEQIEGVPLRVNERQQQGERARHYEAVMRDSVFSLCPSGSGPNSIRLWESIGFGCIPVVLSDDYRPPAPDSLWERAVLSVGENQPEVARLPDLLAKFVADPARIAVALKAGRELWNATGEKPCVEYIQNILAAYLVKGEASA